MNWRVSSLDRFRLTSNSDAHSPGKLGREATRLSCEPDYFAIRHALETGDGYDGTVEFFPEEGKYHLDGHRACSVRLEPAETIAHGGRCPVCGSSVTVGVAHRVDRLADRAQVQAPPATAGEVRSLVPLPEILSEILATGVGSQSVTRAYDRVTVALGPELAALEEVPVEDIARADTLLGEAVTRLRAGKVIRQAGYDGEYGVIRLFEDGELDRLTRGGLLFDAPVRRRARAVRQAAPATGEPDQTPSPAPAIPTSGRQGVLAALDEDQARAAEAIDGPLVVIAGPGSGKTRMLTHRLAHLVRESAVPASSCLAITFTRRATEELRVRLAALGVGDCAVHSFHSLGLAILRAHGGAVGLRPDFRIADEREWAAALGTALTMAESKAARLMKAVSLAKRTGVAADGEVAGALALCRRLRLERNWVDFDDLVRLAVEILESDPAIAAKWRERFQHIAADEFQDVDEQQYRLLCLLAAPDGNLCVIGDPNQAIYGFRGADATCFERFARDFPKARTMRLHRNYRSTGNIVTAAARLIGDEAPADVTRPMQEKIAFHVAPTEWAEAELVAETIESLLGGHDMLAANRDKTAGAKRGPLGFADFAVLYRTDAQSAALREAFDRAGIPFKKSTPAPIAGQASVKALLHALERQGDGDLPSRIAAAANELRQREDAPDPAALAEAIRWLTAIAGSGDEARFREQVTLSKESDFFDARAERVSLLTMHAAKGLEFPIVFVVGMEDGLVPFSWSGLGSVADDEADGTQAAAEERRLFYVAMTRARDRLFLSRAIERAWRGQIRSLPPSPFLRDIPRELVDEQRPPRKARPETRQYSLF
jgi:superfamily I DNA/RNA helicase